MLEFACVVIFVAVALCLSSVKLLKDYERLVIFRLGRVTAVRGPGPQIVWPFVETYRKVDLRVVTLPVPIQEIVSRDGVSLRASAVYYIQIDNPTRAVLYVDDFKNATAHVIEGVFKDVLAGYDFHQLTSINKNIAKSLRSQIEPSTANWGIRITEIVLSVNGATTAVSDAAMVPLPSARSERLFKPGPDHAHAASVTATVPVISSPSASSSISSAAVAPNAVLAGDSGHDGHNVVHHKFEHQAYHRQHKHTHFSFDHDSYDYGGHTYEFGHERKTDQVEQVGNEKPR